MNELWELFRQEIERLGLTPWDGVRLLQNMAECKQHAGQGAQLNVHGDTRSYREGLRAEAQLHRSATFAHAVEQYLRSKAHKRPRTRSECAQVFRRLHKAQPGIGAIELCRFTPESCRSLIDSAYSLPHGRNKAWGQLHALFHYAQKQGWSEHNPLRALSREYTEETPIHILSIEQVKKLVAVLRSPQHYCCLPAVALMLWAGVRPHEVERLHWCNINLEEGVIVLRPRHTKTGGPRVITIHAVLQRHLELYLAAEPRHGGDPVIPRNWTRRWRELRRAAGLEPWQPDTLRHTFASYHLKYFNDPSTLQWEMGHKDMEMLRTRYLDMGDITAAAAAEFWALPRLQPLRPRTAADLRRERRKERRLAQQALRKLP